MKNSGTKNLRSVATLGSWLSREETELWRLEFSEVTRLKVRGEEKALNATLGPLLPHASLETLDKILPGLLHSPSSYRPSSPYPLLTVTLKVSANVQWGRLLRQRQERLPTAPTQAPPLLQLT